MVVALLLGYLPLLVFFRMFRSDVSFGIGLSLYTRFIDLKLGAH